MLIPEDSANFKCRLFGRRHDVLFLGSNWIARVLELNLLKTHKRKVRILAKVKRERTNSHLQDHLTGKLSPLIKVSLLPTARGDSSRKPQLDRTQRSVDGREPNCTGQIHRRHRSCCGPGNVGEKVTQRARMPTSLLRACLSQKGRHKPRSEQQQNPYPC